MGKPTPTIGVDLWGVGLVINPTNQIYVGL